MRQPVLASPSNDCLPHLLFPLMKESILATILSAKASMCALKLSAVWAYSCSKHILRLMSRIDSISFWYCSSKTSKAQLASRSVWVLSIMVHHGRSDLGSPWSVWLMSIMVSMTRVYHGQSDLWLSWSVWSVSITVSLPHVHLPSYLLSAPNHDCHRIYATALTMGENNLITWLLSPWA